MSINSDPTDLSSDIEINKFIVRINNNKLDLENYYRFCKDYNFENQCKSAHYLYNPIDKERFQKDSELITSLYKSLEKDVLETPLITHNSQTKEKRIEGAIEMALIGDAIGFLVESENTIDSIKKNFPNGIFNLKELQKDLVSHKLKTKYGIYNNNNLSKSNNIIYSDDTELSLVTLYSAITNYQKHSSSIEMFTKQVAADLANHWNSLRNSGNYGIDGLYYGPRGYGKKNLQSLSDLFYKNTTLNNHSNNGELIKSWVLGLVPYDNYLTAAFYAAKQSLISNKSYEVAITSAAMAAGIYVATYDSPETKEEVVDKMIYTARLLESLGNNNNISNYLKYAKLAALSDINPIIFYNSSIGYYARETIAGVVFTFLRHKHYLTALLESVYIPGDSDSVAHLLGALMGAYYGIYNFPKEYINYIEKPIVRLDNKNISFDVLLNQLRIINAQNKPSKN